MKRNKETKMDTLMATAAKSVASKGANSACYFFFHQPKMPEKVKGLRKF